jgi:hypothetical protein
LDISLHDAGEAMNPAAFCLRRNSAPTAGTARMLRFSPVSAVDERCEHSGTLSKTLGTILTPISGLAASDGVDAVLKENRCR